MGLGPEQGSGDDLDWSQEVFKEGDVEMGKVQGRPQRRATTAAAVAPLRCPRCDSRNTKFCYYNNYSRSQPRHFCKSCRRHWTKGGTLRNVPVGGGRKSKRSKTSTTSSTRDGRRPEQERLLPTPPLFVSDHLQLRPTLLRSSPSPSPSSSDHPTAVAAAAPVGIDAGCSDGSHDVLGWSPCLPPTPPPAMTNTLIYTPPSDHFSPFKKNRPEGFDGGTTSISPADVGAGDGGQFPLPTCGFAEWNSLEPSSGGGYWDYWDELPGLPDLGRI